MLKSLTKLIGGSNEGVIKKIRRQVVDDVNALESEFEALTDAELRALTDEFRARLQDGETTDDLLHEAFAAVREAAKRTLGQRHFDVQLIGGFALHEGKIAEMRTGEGKTLVATLPAYLNALTGEGVHVVTVNDYLARRDAQWMGQVYDLLGITVGVLQHEGSYVYQSDANSSSAGMEALRAADRRQAYSADITYGTNNEFGFDYLRDNMVLHTSQKVQRERRFAIVDEVDNILIDEARTPLIISGPAEETPRDYSRFARVVPSLAEGRDYDIEEKHRSVSLTPEGMNKVERLLGIKSLYEDSEASFRIVHHVETALRAQNIFQRDREYVVSNGQVVIVDEFTGRLMTGRRFSDGLHQALEAKEGVQVRSETITYATITLQNYFRLYDKLAGMTGTAATEAEEFWKIYKLEVVEIPTNMPMVRDDQPDLIYKNQDAKYRAVVEEIAALHEDGKPVLVGTTDIDKSELVSEMLRRKGVPHEVLNAKQHEREAAIVAQAGQPGAVTVATNMAGPRHRHHPRRQPGQPRHRRRQVAEGARLGHGARRPAHHRHRAPRRQAHRQPASRARRTPGRPRQYQVLRGAGRRVDAPLRRRAHQQLHGVGRPGRGRAHRDQDDKQVHRGRAGEGGGLPLRHAQAPGGLRRRDEHAP